jgi:ribonucleoside-diphosphate reductase alpha chain
LIDAGYDSGYEGEAYATVSGQNSNNSVRIPNKFFEALKNDGEWDLISRTNGKPIKSVPAQKVWDDISFAAWACADPGVQYDTTINEWHTCPEGGQINASNPCSEYMFLDNTACNLASLNLRKYYNEETKELDVEAIKYASRLWTVVLEISVLMAQFPSKEVAELSYQYRTLGLGYANIGSVFMVSGIAYDSPEASAICGAVTAILTGTSYATSAEMASFLGTFEQYDKNKEHMLRVMNNHRYAAYNLDEYDGLSIKPVGIDPAYCPEYLLGSATSTWDQAVQWGEKYGYRNAQTTVIAPTGTIGLVMDCDTTGIEPDFALVKFKKLSGGGYFKIVNQSVPLALKNLGYEDMQINEIVNYAKGYATLENAPHINHDTLRAKGFKSEDLEKIEAGLASAFEISFAFNQWVLGDATMERLGFTSEQYNKEGFSLLRALGFSKSEIHEANDFVCGTMTVEGAPHLKNEHLAVFDCANKCGEIGERYIHAHGHIKMMAAAQPFLSGAISKTINLPNEATIEDIKSCYQLSWELGTKANALYRDGSKLSQPLSNKSDVEETEEEDAISAVDNALAGAATLSIEELTQEQVLEAAQKILDNSKSTEFMRQLSGIVERKKLPWKRRGFTQKAKVGGQTLFVRTGEYNDGTLGEIFIDMHREGATFRSLMNCFSIAVSIGLQYGVPLDEYVSKFTFARFEPSGMVEGHPNIKNSTSIIDYIFRLLGFEYLDRTDLVHIKPTKEEAQAKVEAKQNKMSDTPKPTVSVTSAPTVKPVSAAQPATAASFSAQQPKATSGDALPCTNCGSLALIRNGTCHLCTNCGTTTGCS